MSLFLSINENSDYQDGYLLMRMHIFHMTKNSKKKFKFSAKHSFLVFLIWLYFSYIIIYECIYTYVHVWIQFHNLWKRDRREASLLFLIYDFRNNKPFYNDSGSQIYKLSKCTFIEIPGFDTIFTQFSYWFKITKQITKQNTSETKNKS